MKPEHPAGANLNPRPLLDIRIANRNGFVIEGDEHSTHLLNAVSPEDRSIPFALRRRSNREGNGLKPRKAERSGRRASFAEFQFSSVGKR